MQMAVSEQILVEGLLRKTRSQYFSEQIFIVWE